MVRAFVQANDYQRKIPSWTFKRLQAGKFVNKTGGETEKFDPDYELPVMFRTTERDFDILQKLGFHAGHAAPAGNYQGDFEQWRNTYWFSNAVAMHHQLNQGAWGTIEDRARNAARDVKKASMDGRCYALTVCAFRRYINLLIIIIALLTNM